MYQNSKVKVIIINKWLYLIFLSENVVKFIIKLLKNFDE